jgi:ubiquitin-protein ligase
MNIKNKYKDSKMENNKVILSWYIKYSEYIHNIELNNNILEIHLIFPKFISKLQINLDNMNSNNFSEIITYNSDILIDLDKFISNLDNIFNILQNLSDYILYHHDISNNSDSDNEIVDIDTFISDSFDDVSDCNSDESHDDDSHEDDSHDDESHDDESHKDESHEDDSHDDESHKDESHEDDSHDDESHKDESHKDESHDDVKHETDIHKDESHETETIDIDTKDFEDFYNKINTEPEEYYLDEFLIKETSIDIIKNESEINDIEFFKFKFQDIAIINMILLQVRQLNKRDNIKIKPIDNNIFMLDIVIVNPKINILCNMPTRTYPYSPHKITILEPNMNSDFLYALERLEYFKQENWNPINSLEYTIDSICKIIHENENEKEKDDINTNDKIIENNIFKIWNELNIINNKISINIEFIRLDIKKNNNFLANGIGYSNSLSSSWNINSFLQNQNNKDDKIFKYLDNIKNNIFKFNHKLLSLFMPIIKAYLYDINILEMITKNNIYNIILDIVVMYLDDIKILEPEIIQQLYISQQNIKDYITLTNDLEYIIMFNKILNLSLENKKSFIETNDYNILLQFQVEEYDDENTPIINLNKHLNIKRISREFINLKKSLPFNYDSSIFLRYNPENLSKFKFLIIGPKDTPYENGCYFFEMSLPYDYPNKCPNVLFLTTGNGTVRFNPNLYNNGKVCLSLLGTWSGNEGETWNTTSTILQVLVSIQSLIFTEHPYFNEPGYDKYYGTSTGIIASKNYNLTIQKNNYKWAILDIINNPVLGFENVINTHFKIKKNDILLNIQKNKLNDFTIPLQNALNKL